MKIVVIGGTGLIGSKLVPGAQEIAGPERLSLSDLIGRCLRAKGDTREVIADPAAPYFGVMKP
jgi:uncharacterized protein YbjT (DUF2867 family)